MDIHESIRPFVEAAHEAGFTVTLPEERSWYHEATFVYVTREGAPGIAMIQRASNWRFEPVQVDVPVYPNRDHGSAVVQDHDGSVQDVVRLLGELVERDTVRTRFVKVPTTVAVDRRIPENGTVYA